MSQDLYIAGVVVFAHKHLEAVCESVSAMPDTQVHGASPEGKLVVTVEAGSTGEILDRMDAIRCLPGVVDVALVYQHAEPLDDLLEEIEA